MKIAILSFYSGQVERGVESFTHELAKRLAKNHSVYVFQNGSKKRTDKYRTISSGLKVDWNKQYSNIRLARVLFLDYWSVRVAFFTLKILNLLAKENFDIIIPTNGGWQVGLIRILTWIKRKKMLIVGLAGNGWDDINNLWSFPDTFVAMSERSKKWARKVNPLFLKVIVIPAGADLKLFNPSGKKARINLKPPIILAVGAAHKGKRLELAIRAVSKLKSASLLILGTGPYKKKINKLGKKLLGNRFLLKSVSYEEIPEYYRAANIFTLPSWSYEAFGIVYLEAMASGIPVVATDDELRREIVEDAGVLVDPTDSEAYAEALEKTLTTNWGDKPRNQAEKFDWDKIVKKYEGLFHEILK